MDTDLFVAAMTALAVLAVIWAVVLIRERREKRRRILDRAAGKLGGRDLAAQDAQSAGVSAQALKAGLAQSLTRLGEYFAPKKAEEASALRLELIRAGYRKNSAHTTFWGVKIGLALIGMGAAVMLHATAMAQAQGQLVALVYLSFPGLGLYLPNMWLRRAGEARRKAIRNALPDALDLLVVCVEAGMGLDQAVYRVSQELREGYPVMSDEFRQLNLELRAGKSRRDALKNLAWRIGIDDVNSLTALLIQSDLFGTSIAQTLRVYADAMRTKRFQLAEEIAAKLPVKMLLPLIFFILPPLFLVIMGPGVIRLAGILGGLTN